MSRRPKLYTLEEANELIPRLLDIFPKLRYIREQIIKERDRCDVEEITSHGLTGEKAREARERIERHRSQIQSLESDMEKSLKIFEGHDCELKGLDPGLVDFYTERRGELVYLCWRENEPRIQYWHTLTGGFAGRQPLT